MTESISPEVAAKPLFIVNPNSGGGRTRNRVGTIIDAIERAGLAADMVFTTHRGHGIELAEEAIDAGRFNHAIPRPERQPSGFNQKNFAGGRSLIR